MTKVHGASALKPLETMKLDGLFPFPIGLAKPTFPYV